MRHSYQRCALLALLVLSSSPVAAQARRPAAPVRLEITAAVVGPNMEIKPLPLLRLEVIRKGDSTKAGELQTGLRGTASGDFAVGDYIVRSVSPVELEGKSYRWEVEVALHGPGPVSSELTNANAIATALVQAPSLQRQVSPELEVYQRSRASVFQVSAGLKSGTGFLVSDNGLVLTNAHVVAGEFEVTVALDTLHRVPAQILWRDRDQDVAVLRIHPVRATGLRPLPLALEDSIASVQVGERVLAIGFPLHQEQSLTTGIVSNVRSGAIISDVNINHGNSGGPMMTLDGKVVAINAFGDVSDDRAGPGISGSISIRVARVALDSGRVVADTLALPDSTFLDVQPREALPLALVRAAADSAILSNYRKFDGYGFLGFQIVTTTPVSSLLRRRAFDADLSRDRRRREARANVPTEERYNEILTDFEWNRYVGADRSPVVAFSIQPKLGETGGSILTRALLTGPYGRQTLRYKGDLQAVAVFRNNERVIPFLAGRGPVRAYENNMWVDLRDVAYGGYVVLDPRLFRPDTMGAPAVVHLCLTDLKSSGRSYCKAVPKEIAAAVWNEFVGYGLLANSPGGAQRADPRKRPQFETRGPHGYLDEYGNPIP